MNETYCIPSLYWLLGEKDRVYVDEAFCDEVQTLIYSLLNEARTNQKRLTARELQQLHYLVDMFVDACNSLKKDINKKPR